MEERDCTTCRVLGVTTFSGAGAMSMWERSRTPVTNVSARRGLGVAAALMFSLAGARLFY
jgi:hypothetical protein